MGAKNKTSNTSQALNASFAPIERLLLFYGIGTQNLIWSPEKFLENLARMWGAKGHQNKFRSRRTSESKCHNWGNVFTFSQRDNTKKHVKWWGPKWKWPFPWCKGANSSPIGEQKISRSPEAVRGPPSRWGDVGWAIRGGIRQQDVAAPGGQCSVQNTIRG